jgi:hypothetical protein
MFRHFSAIFGEVADKGKYYKLFKICILNLLLQTCDITSYYCIFFLLNISLKMAEKRPKHIELPHMFVFCCT